MSLERELLKKWVDKCMWRGSNMSLLEETKELLARPETTQDRDLAYIEASSLALSLHKKFYAEESPNFGLCDSTAGIITQINNMTCGLMKIPDEPEQEPVAWQYRTKPNWTGNWSKW